MLILPFTETSHTIDMGSFEDPTGNNNPSYITLIEEGLPRKWENGNPSLFGD